MTDIVVVVTGDHRARIGQVADALRAAGMQVVQVLDVIGQITGAVAEERLDDLRDVPGVQRVDRSGGARIAPPDSPLQ
ncbi:MAG: hypothetical protein AB7L91_19535 [Dehalococcoidia bacterium]